MEIVYLHNNVLTDDYVEIYKDKCVLHYFVFETCHKDKEIIKTFNSFSNFEKFYNKLNRGKIEEYF